MQSLYNYLTEETIYSYKSNDFEFIHDDRYFKISRVKYTIDGNKFNIITTNKYKYPLELDLSNIALKQLEDIGKQYFNKVLPGWDLKDMNGMQFWIHFINCCYDSKIGKFVTTSLTRQGKLKITKDPLDWEASTNTSPGNSGRDLIDPIILDYSKLPESTIAVVKSKIEKLKDERPFKEYVKNLRKIIKSKGTQSFYSSDVIKNGSMSEENQITTFFGKKS